MVSFGHFFRFERDGQALLVLLPSEEEEMVKVRKRMTVEFVDREPRYLGLDY